MLDEVYMSRALELAKRGRFTTSPNPNVGCVIVKNNHIIGEGWHQRAGEDHAEINALKKITVNKQAEGATVYVTLEPCSHFGKVPPCCNALINAGIKRVVAAMTDPNPRVNGRGFHLLKQAGIEVKQGLMINQAKMLNRGFIKRMKTGLPFIRLKLAMSIDGRTAMQTGESKWITSVTSRRDVQVMRAESSALLSSGMTIQTDNPSLTVRWKELDEENKKFLSESTLRQPTRIIIDSKNLVTPEHHIINQPGETWLIRHIFDNNKWHNKVKQIIAPLKDGKIDITSLINILGNLEINDILVEAGAKLSGSFIKAHAVDEIIIYIAPKILGTTARGLCELNHLTELKDAFKFKFTDMSQLGKDIRLTLLPDND
ncbi:bifunctional diaminohydroxyphosphoribosylaminopyrimidine deaminase/5-amino-6-(5-phosphoribosylamino)uracil reductase RibD [Candidatus Ishikawella capsulata]|uniref:Riboflavin biosynthesis protein RibD n=1 Tax=Candidatus Ishikawaella capsulata Mpkobe TaxID=476281 RepID=C5WCP1_9ENTR|nr:bifunctional diaminohydroxyphosphoribosylaminopyrimidine deaminase/5-amino-6-(5-phosphoribosylamino)uracil reductase RibD [Candidatus Ishikawaella capsulata]BAH83097.1 fused diaminohydroxyphosphoribosylaminopyrimidin e deaminase and 5-amino-6-(5-phosphoribosylamino) uracil reductase [Candidatus Ishikawaella capsulata Mpkobe]